MLHSNFIRRGIVVMVFCCLVGSLLALLRGGAWDVQMVYSFAIGMSSFACIDLGRIALTRGSAIPWPLGWRGIALVAVGTVFGYVVGMALGDRYSGLQLGGMRFLDSRAALASLCIAIATSVSITFFFYSKSKQKELLRTAKEAQLKLLESQLEPHMLFNSLANLHALIAADPPRAQAMLDHLIAYLRATLGASRATQHALATEFDRLRDYLEILAVRMGPRLRYQLELPDTLAQLPIPPLLLQALVENAIRHGLEPQLAGGTITVRAQEANNRRLRIEVLDTGAGLLAAATASMATGSASTASGFGLAQVRIRLTTLYGVEGTLELLPNPPQGTCARITLPMP